MHGKHIMKWVVLELASVNTEHHQFVFPSLSLAFTRSLTVRSTNLFFPRSNVLVHHIHHSGWCCVLVFRGGIFILSSSYPCSLSHSSTQYHSIFRHPAVPLSVPFFCQTSISKTFISLATLPFDCIPLWNFEDFCQYTKMSLKFDWIGVRAQWITQNKKRQHVIEMMSAKYKRVITTTVRTSTLNKIIRNKNRDKIYLAPIIYCLSLFNIPLPHLAFLCERTANSIRSDFKGFEFRCINYPSLMPKF